jgi:hypothetical protein
MRCRPLISTVSSGPPNRSLTRLQGPRDASAVEPAPPRRRVRRRGSLDLVERRSDRDIYNRARNSPAIDTRRDAEISVDRCGSDAPGTGATHTRMRRYVPLSSRGWAWLSTGEPTKAWARTADQHLSSIGHGLTWERCSPCDAVFCCELITDDEVLSPARPTRRSRPTGLDRTHRHSEGTSSRRREGVRCAPQC